MDIIREHHESGWGEHDFHFSSAENAKEAANALRDNGYMVGGGNDPLQICIATDTHYSSDVDEARRVILEI